MFDPRTLHCGGANTSNAHGQSPVAAHGISAVAKAGGIAGGGRRVLLYLSFRNPHCRSDVEVPPGSVLKGLRLSLGDLRGD